MAKKTKNNKKGHNSNNKNKKKTGASFPNKKDDKNCSMMAFVNMKTVSPLKN